MLDLCDDGSSLSVLTASIKLLMETAEEKVDQMSNSPDSTSYCQYMKRVSVDKFREHVSKCSRCSEAIERKQISEIA